MKSRNIAASLLSVVAVSAAVAHAFFPQLQADSTTAFLLAVAVLPWLGLFFKTVELPGGIKVEYQELKEAEEKAREVGLLNDGSENKKLKADPLYERIASEDPNLALAGLRIEIERELISLGARHGVIADRKSTLWIAKELAQMKILGAGAYLALADIIHLLNRAVHGAKVESDFAHRALRSGSSILNTLREK